MAENFRTVLLYKAKFIRIQIIAQTACELE